METVEKSLGWALGKYECMNEDVEDCIAFLWKGLPRVAQELGIGT